MQGRRRGEGFKALQSQGLKVHISPLVGRGEGAEDEVITPYLEGAVPYPSAGTAGKKNLIGP